MKKIKKWKERTKAEKAKTEALDRLKRKPKKQSASLKSAKQLM